MGSRPPGPGAEGAASGDPKGDGGGDPKGDGGGDPKGDGPADKGKDDLRLPPMDSGAFGPGESPWPFLSPLDEALSSSIAGSEWPFHAKSETETSKLDVQLGAAGPLAPLDAALLARAAAELPEGPERDLALSRLQDPSTQTLLPESSAGALAVLVRGLGSLPQDAGCGDLLRRAAGELLERRPLRAAHAATLLAALRPAGGAGVLPAVGSSPALRAAAEAFAEDIGEQLTFAEATAALEGLAALRAAPLDTTTDALLAGPAAALAARLRGGAGVGALLTGPGRVPQHRGIMMRFLAALQSLPEVTAQGNMASWLSSVRGIRWPKSLPSGASEETAAAAACVLARCGAWSTARCSSLLMQALKRDLASREEMGVGSLTRNAGALWLYTLAQAGKSLDSALDDVGLSPAPEKVTSHVEEALLGSAEALVVEDDGSAVAMARALWALCALGKTEERGGLGKALLSSLAAADPGRFTAETWALLREARQSLAPAPAEGEEGAEGEADGPAATFASAPWQRGLEEAGVAEARRLEATGRSGELAAMLEVGRTMGEAEVGDMEERLPLGPYTLAVKVGSHGVGLDLDACESFAGRALRRQQWATLAPDLRVAEVSLGDWDRSSGMDRKDLLRRRLLGIGDAEDEED